MSNAFRMKILAICIT